MDYTQGKQKMAELQARMAQTRDEMASLRRSIEPEAVRDYTFSNASGEVRLSQLFGDKSDLFVIHNMGSSCPYCTLWADGFNGAYQHLANRAAFVVSTPDSPQTQQRFAAGRHWNFPMVSHTGSSFAADMGYRAEKGGWLPGVSVFQRDAQCIVRVADSGFGPGDDFCALWHFLALLPQGAQDWHPRFSYASQ